MIEKQHPKFHSMLKTFAENNLMVMPAKPEKTPLYRWGHYKDMSPSEINYYEYYFELLNNRTALVLGGAASNNVVMIDLDKFSNGYCAYDEFTKLLSFEIPTVVTSGGGGKHLYIRSNEFLLGGNTLARFPMPDGYNLTSYTQINEFHEAMKNAPKIEGTNQTKIKFKNLIELKGKGKYVIAPYSYTKTVNGVDRFYLPDNHDNMESFINDIPTLTKTQVEEMLMVATLFDARVESNDSKSLPVKEVLKKSEASDVFGFTSAAIQNAMNDPKQQIISKDGHMICTPFDNKDDDFSWYRKTYNILDTLLAEGYKVVDKPGRSERELYLISPYGQEGQKKTGTEKKGPNYQDVSVFLDLNRSYHRNPNDELHNDEGENRLVSSVDVLYEFNRNTTNKGRLLQDIAYYIKQLRNPKPKKQTESQVVKKFAFNCTQQ